MDVERCCYMKTFFRRFFLIRDDVDDDGGRELPREIGSSLSSLLSALSLSVPLRCVYLPSLTDLFPLLCFPLEPTPFARSFARFLFSASCLLISSCTMSGKSFVCVYHNADTTTMIGNAQTHAAENFWSKHSPSHDHTHTSLSLSLSLSLSSTPNRLHSQNTLFVACTYVCALQVSKQQRQQMERNRHPEVHSIVPQNSLLPLVATPAFA